MCQLRLSSAHAASRSRIDLNRLGKTRIWVFKPMAGSFRTPFRRERELYLTNF